MVCSLRRLLCAFPLLFISTSAQGLKAFSTAAQDSMIQIGIALYDNGEYDKAIVVYQAVLKENPANALAHAELAFTCFAKQQYADAIQTASEGLKYDSKYRSVLYLHLGNSYDMLGEKEKAFSAFREGLVYNPNGYMLHFNLGLAFHRDNQIDSARAHYQSALVANPNHPSSNLALGKLYEYTHKRVPAILALTRFLILEPTSNRSIDAAGRLRNLLSDSLSITRNSKNESTITVLPDSDEVDGDLTTLELALAMTQSVTVSVDSAHTSPIARVASELSKLFQVESELLASGNHKGFCWTYYAPYFAEMQTRGFTNTVVRFIFRSTDKQEVLDYMRTNFKNAKDFTTWNSQYHWK